MDDNELENYVPVPGASNKLPKPQQKQENGNSGSDFNYSITMKSNKIGSNPRKSGSNQG